MPRIHGFEARSGELARRSAHDLPNDGGGLRHVNAANSFRATAKPEVILEWCQQAWHSLENDSCVERPISNYLWRAFSLSSARFNSSNFCPASPSLPSAVRRWYSARSLAASAISVLRSSVGWDDAADAGVLREGSAVTAVALSDDTPPPKRADIADSKVGPYARRSCSASTTRRNSGIGLRSACR